MPAPRVERSDPRVKRSDPKVGRFDLKVKPSDPRGEWSDPQVKRPGSKGERLAPKVKRRAPKVEPPAPEVRPCDLWGEPPAPKGRSLDLQVSRLTNRVEPSAGKVRLRTPKVASLPGEAGLLEMGYAGMPAVHGHLGELVEDRRGWRVEEAPGRQVQGEDRLGLRGGGLQDDPVGGEFLDRKEHDGGHLTGIGPQDGAGCWAAGAARRPCARRKMDDFLLLEPTQYLVHQGIHTDVQLPAVLDQLGLAVGIAESDRQPQDVGEMDIELALGNHNRF